MTLGDPSGIGPEIITKAIPQVQKRHPQIHFHLIGSTKGVTPGRPGKKSALLALEALEESARLLRSGQISGVVNGPVWKEGLMKLGFRYPGQTEFYAHCAGLKEEDVTMIMYSPKITVGLVTTHCSLKQAVRRVNEKRLRRATRQLHDFFLSLGTRNPKLAVAGLNPHAGEAGAFGVEELELISPLVKKMKKEMKNLVGPVSPDAVFAECWQGKWDGVVSLYHDQGLIPFKLVAFEEGVNTTGGLPFVRTSPDHGTAFDLAGKGIASEKSMVAALELAVLRLT